MLILKWYFGKLMDVIQVKSFAPKMRQVPEQLTAEEIDTAMSRVALEN